MKSRLVRALPALLLAAAVALGTGSVTVSAHAIVVQTDPADGSVLTQAPRHVRLWFNIGVILRLTQIGLVDGDGHHLAVLGVRADPASTTHGDPDVLVVDLPRLRPNAYRLTFETVSADDLHVTVASLVFGVQRLAGAVPPPNATSSVPQPAEVVLRWLDVGAMAALLGALAIMLVAVPAATPLGARASDSHMRSPRRYPSTPILALHRRLLRLIITASAIGIVVGFGLLLVQSAAAGSSWWQIVSASGYGTRWLLRLFLLIGIGVGAVMLPSRPAHRHTDDGIRALADVRPGLRRAALRVLVPLVMALVIVHALSSHAAAYAGGALVPVAADVAHLLAAGLWVGGLLALAIAIVPLLRHGPEEASLARTILRRFGAVAAASVAMLLVSGLYLMGQQVASLDALALTLYGRALIIKVVVALCVALIGLFHAAAFHPRVAALLGAALRRPAGWAPLQPPRLQRTLLLEVTGGTAIVLLAAAMSASPPARGPQFEPSAPQVAAPSSVVQPVADLLFTLSVEPDHPGPNFVTIGVYNTRRPAPGPIERVDVRFDGPRHRSAPATPLGSGRYQVAGGLLDAAGQWRISVAVKRGGMGVTRLTVPWTIVPLVQIPPRRVIFSNQPLAQVLNGIAIAVALLLVGTLVAFGLRWRMATTAASRIVDDDTRELHVL